MIYKISDIAKRWGCHRDSVIKAINNGMKYFKVGREYRIREDWLLEYEERNQGGETDAR